MGRSVRITLAALLFLGLFSSASFAESLVSRLESQMFEYGYLLGISGALRGISNQPNGFGDAEYWIREFEIRRGAANLVEQDIRSRLSSFSTPSIKTGLSEILIDLQNVPKDGFGTATYWAKEKVPQQRDALYRIYEKLTRLSSLSEQTLNQSYGEIVLLLKTANLQPEKLDAAVAKINSIKQEIDALKASAEQTRIQNKTLEALRDNLTREVSSLGSTKSIYLSEISQQQSLLKNVKSEIQTSEKKVADNKAILEDIFNEVRKALPNGQHTFYYVGLSSLPVEVSDRFKKDLEVAFEKELLRFLEEERLNRRFFLPNFRFTLDLSEIVPIKKGFFRRVVGYRMKMDPRVIVSGKFNGRQVSLKPVSLEYYLGPDKPQLQMSQAVEDVINSFVWKEIPALIHAIEESEKDSKIEELIEEIVVEKCADLAKRQLE
ncbi:MAG: hypothetical protein AB7F43_11640 [Bacteriovoracia bacterium]